MDPVKAKRKSEDATRILGALGLPREQQINKHLLSLGVAAHFFGFRS
jgi:hypothetical protein